MTHSEFLNKLQDAVLIIEGELDIMTCGNLAHCRGIARNKVSFIKKLIAKQINPKQYAKVTKDVISHGFYKGDSIWLPKSGTTRKRFEIYDIDGKVCFAGYFYDDKNHFNQEEILQWSLRLGEGCHHILVKEGRGNFTKELNMAKQK